MFFQQYFIKCTSLPAILTNYFSWRSKFLIKFFLDLPIEFGKETSKIRRKTWTYANISSDAIISSLKNYIYIVSVIYATMHEEKIDITISSSIFYCNWQLKYITMISGQFVSFDCLENIT